MRMSAYEAPSDRAFSRATLPSVSSRSGAGYAASERRTTKAPGTNSKAARASADAPQDLRNSLRLGPCTDRLLEPAGGADTPPPPPGHAALQESARTRFSASISAPARRPRSDDIFLSLRSSFLSWLSTFLSRGPTVDFSVLAMTASSAPATSGV